MRKMVIPFLGWMILNLSAAQVFAQVISDIRTSNITSAAAAVSWITDTPKNTNEVHYGTTTALGSTATDNVLDDVHRVAISDLDSDTNYFYEVSSDGSRDNNNGAYYTFKTAQVGFGNVFALAGKVFKKEGTPAERTVVYVTVTSNQVTSAPLSGLSNAQGDWFVNLGNLKNASSGQVHVWNQGDTINIFAQGAAEGTASSSDVISGGVSQQVGDLSLPVQLSAFIALPKNEGILLKWTTESELNNMGWNVYRSEKSEGDYLKLNPSLIKGAGTSSTPSHYQYLDTEVEKGKTYYYYLEDIDFNGNPSKSQIVSAVAGKRTIDWVGKVLTLWGKMKQF